MPLHPTPTRRRPAPTLAAPRPARLAAPVPPRMIEREIAGLAGRCHRGSAGPLHVFEARADEVPATLLEIGRLRERAARAVGLGTGRPRDLDELDAHHAQLFVWEPGRRRVVGGCRMAASEDVLAELGARGLHVEARFDVEPRFYEALGPFLELSGAFVRPEHRGELGPLLLLWRAIAARVAEEPRYRRLVGPVGLGAGLGEPARRRIAAFLRRRAAAPELSSCVRAKRPFPSAGPEAEVPRTLAELRGELRLLEPLGRPVPALLRGYLGLGARLLDLSVDPVFGDALDALVLVELDRSPARLLRRSLGEQGLARLRERPSELRLAQAWGRPSSAPHPRAISFGRT